jgi:2-polyprenyl-3-methyl-5-hydroxy-6-metoxy-1,4-benzoquinol methylase
MCYSIYKRGDHGQGVKMAADDRSKWNLRYHGEGLFHGSAPSRLLEQNITLLESHVPGRRALDLACGEGRNALFLARRGFQVTALDIAEEGIEKGRRRAMEEGLEVDFQVMDLERDAIEGEFDLVLNVNFLLRKLIPGLVAHLSPGGLIFFLTILNTPALAGGRNPAHLLEPGELAGVFAGFTGELLLSEERPEGPSPSALVIFRKSVDGEGALEGISP